MPSLRYRAMHKAIALAANRGEHGALTIEALRSLQGPPGFPAPAETPGVTCTPIELGAITGESVVPDDVSEPAGHLFFLHGGGYVAASAANQRKLVASLCTKAGLHAWSMDYRLAPEHPFPAALDDAMAAYRGALQQVPAQQIVLAGESAGAGLALALALRAKDEGVALPRAIVALWPWTDLTNSGESITANKGKDFLTPHFCDEAAAAYIGSADAKDPYVSPLYGELAGLPPVFLQAGSLDLVVDDSRRLAAALTAQGVAVELRIWKGYGHAWAASADDSSDSRRANVECAEWIRTRLT